MALTSDSAKHESDTSRTTVRYVYTRGSLQCVLSNSCFLATVCDTVEVYYRAWYLFRHQLPNHDASNYIVPYLRQKCQP